MRSFNFPFLGSRPKTSASVYLSNTAVALSCVQPSERGLTVCCRADPLREGDSLVDRLNTQVSALKVNESEVSLVLAPDYYNLSLIERPDVADDEVTDAVRWRLQDSIDYPVDQAVIDTFAMPESATRGRPEMLFVASMKKSRLQTLIEMVHATGLKPECVDITELALRNIAQLLYPSPEYAVGFLRVTAWSGFINITRDEELFLSRRLTGTPAALEEGEWDTFREGLLLQVQRSMDYYESALAQPPASALLVAAAQGWQQQIVQYLGEMLPMAVLSHSEQLCERLDIILFNPDRMRLDARNLTLDQEKSLAAAAPAIGGLLRQLETAGVAL